MPRLYLVRHAKPAAAWGDDPDPGLDAVGKEQAASAARALADLLARVPVLSSPLLRCRETAAPLSELWRTEIRIVSEVGEIPSPPLDPTARREWLMTAMQGEWAHLQHTGSEFGMDYALWRRGVIATLLGLSNDCVIYTHYIAINAAVGAAIGSERVVCCRPDHASITVLDASSEGLRLHALGREAVTSVLPGQ